MIPEKQNQVFFFILNQFWTKKQQVSFVTGHFALLNYMVNNPVNISYVVKLSHNHNVTIVSSKAWHKLPLIVPDGQSPIRSPGPSVCYPLPPSCALIDSSNISVNLRHITWCLPNSLLGLVDLIDPIQALGSRILPITSTFKNTTSTGHFLVPWG